MHKKCKSKDTIISFRDSTYCKDCIDHNDIIRYNPFYTPPHFADNGPFDQEPIDYIESIQSISHILENCQSFSINELNNHNAISSGDVKLFSTFFLNIDGNPTNFDNFAVQMASIKHKFSVIGLAETNTDAENGNLYQLHEYSPLY